MIDYGLRALISNFLSSFIPEGWVSVISFVITVTIMYIVVVVVTKLFNKFIDKVFIKREAASAKEERRLKTIGTLLKSIGKYFLNFIFIMMVLSELGINTTGIIASAGILGLALGFGAQNLVKDWISGFFIIFEDHFAVGDYVTIGDKTGTVEEMAIRVTKVRDSGGQLHIIPNGSIEGVTNYRSKELRVLFDVGVALDTNVDHAIDVLRKAFEENKGNFKDIIKEPQVLGISDVKGDSVFIRVVATGVPLQHWQAERDLRLFVKKVLDANNIETPYGTQKVIIEKE